MIWAIVALFFLREIDGHFDAVWDRGSISALYRGDLDTYVHKNLNQLPMFN